MAFGEGNLSAYYLIILPVNPTSYSAHDYKTEASPFLAGAYLNKHTNALVKKYATWFPFSNRNIIIFNIHFGLLPSFFLDSSN